MSIPGRQFFDHRSRDSNGVDSGNASSIGATASSAQEAAGLAGADRGTSDGGEHKERTDFPCSVAQERFWLLDRLDPGNSSYNVAVRWRLEGRVLTDVLERAWLNIIERHEILRTVFVEIDGAPIQRVMTDGNFRLNEIDLSNLPAESQPTEADRIGVIEARAPFDLANGPLVRATLLRFSANVSVILVTTHQVVSDGWSVGVMAREMGHIYQALRHHEPIALEPLSIQYADYSLWQLEWLRVRGTDAEVAYWTRQLAHVKPFKVISDHPRPAVPTTNGAIASRLLPRSLTNRAQSLSAERGATLFATALAALCAMLARLTHETDIVLGTQVSDRDQVELEPMVGQFVNSLVLRNDLAGNPSFGEIVDGVRETVAQALEHRHIPIERLLGMVKGERSHVNSPSISVNFIFQKTFIQNTTYKDFDLIDLPSLPAGAIYDLNFFMVERPDGWRFSCQYNTDQFDALTAERLIAYFETLLQNAVADSSRRLSDLALCTADESLRLLDQLNGTRALYPRELTLVELFEAQVRNTPHAVAAASTERQLTYTELNAAADRVAAFLRAQGIAPGMRIGIGLARVIELPVCVLAVLKARATCVPLDSGDLPLRQAKLLADAKVQAILVLDGRKSTWAGGPHRVIDVASALAFDAALTGTAQNAPLDCDAPACLVAASVGTSNTSLLGIAHRSLSNLVYSVAKTLRVSDRDTLLSTAPILSDRAMFEIFLPLLTGARLLLAAESELSSGAALADLLRRSKANVMHADADTWTQLLEAGWVGMPGIKLLCSAHEIGNLPSDRLSRLGDGLWSLYGTPGLGIWSSIHRVKEGAANAILGQPVANTVLFVLDDSARIAPVGSVGQIYVGGDGITGKDVPAPSVEIEGSRVYPTGDWGRLIANGQIELICGSDARLLHRGRWISPLEIESLLCQDSGVAACAVTYHKDSAARGALTVHVVARGHEDPAALSKRLVRFLPAFLEPSIQLRADLPLTPAGAVDRRALGMTAGRSETRRDARRPSADIESRLARIWARMLQVDTVGPEDNFFELGGHSLLAARMLTQVEREFGRRVRLAALFTAPTLREFAHVLAQRDLREFDFRQVVKIQPHGSKRPLIAINNTGIYYRFAKCLGPHQPVYSLQLFDPSVKTTLLPETLEGIAAGYVELIRRVQPRGPYELMGWCVAGALSFEIARQLTAEGQVVSHLFLIDSWVPGYLKRQPRLRGIVANLSLRVQLIFVDLRKVSSSEKSWTNFILNRTLVRKLLTLLSIKSGQPHLTKSLRPGETYDEWLLAYLQRVTAAYTPGVYHGKITLLRSKKEPTGLFFKPHAGWADFASAGVDVHFIDGNHYSMFQDPGAGQLAAQVAATLDAPGDAGPATSGS